MLEGQPSAARQICFRPLQCTAVRSRFLNSVAAACALWLNDIFPAAAVDFLGAPALASPAGPSPLTAEEQLRAFSLPPGFEMELVAADPELTKVVTVAFDDAGRMWTITAMEYPVDENENAERAAALYANPGRDRVLVFDDISRSRAQPRVFAD